MERIRAALRLHSPLLAAQRHVRDGDREKLEGLPPEAIDRLWSGKAADFLICEADGARHKPLKAGGVTDGIGGLLTCIVSAVLLLCDGGSRGR